MDLPKGLGLGLNSNSLGDIFDTTSEMTGKAGDVKGVNSVGSGTLASVGGTPLIATIAFAQHITRLSGSLSKVGPDTPLTTSSFQDIEVLVASVLDKMQGTQEAVEKNKVNLTQAKQKGALQDKAIKQEEAVRKQEEAEEKQKSLSIWQKIALAFQWLAAVLTLVVGSILSAVPGLQALGGLMIAAGVIQVIMAVDATVQAATGQSIAAHIATAAGASEETISKLDIAFKVVAAVVGIVIGIASFFVPGGQASGIAALIQSLSSITSAIIQVGTSVGSVVAGVVSYTASQDIAQSKELQADAGDLDAFIQLLSQIIDQLLSILTKAGEQFADALDGTVSSMNERADTLSRTKFAG
ncbi:MULTISPECIES: type III secretion system translocon subunit SctE [unclassified Pseudovibrio]|uniref:type III secretion system translocon subunit SctE n=1 Tax=unclassified Pseudovibrio TaxID=2627060 RepID=UPI0007AE84B6|nr:MULTISPECIES: type III secretion system translocon subunit SctE [unclassified Pseudovibrio]KZL17160.1 Secretion system effector C (SseC) like family protein [Pseudovibrio sp. Ad37]KZL28422.1 Secretion system effector C (SseC) like family protein [Pseudovibrio sp. WM33]